MKQETTIDDVGGGMLVVEAPSVEDALAAVAEQIGPEGTIISAEKVSRGGVGGFFAKEIYRVSFQTTPQDHVPLETVADAPAPLIDVRSVVDRTAALAAAEDSVLDLRDGIDNSTAAVDRVLEWEEAPVEAAVPAPAPAPAAPSSTPATFGEALRAQLEARGAAPQAPTASAAAPVVDAAPVPSATVATPTVPTASPTPTARQHQAAETYAAAAPQAPAVQPQAPVVRSETAVAAQPTSAETTLVVDTETEPQSRPGRTSLGHAPDGVVPGTGSVQWNADALSRLGLPFSLIQPLADLDTNDDLALSAEEIAAGVTERLANRKPNRDIETLLDLDVDGDLVTTLSDIDQIVGFTEVQ